MTPSANTSPGPAGGAALVPALLRLVRFEHTVFALPFAFAGALLAELAVPPAATLGWILLAMVGARSLAMALNRLIDRHIDARNPRTASRELPAGVLRVDQVWWFAAVSLAALLVAGKDAALWCTETRPYLQGARLTSHSAAEMGIPATVITDGMVADAMRQGKVSLFMTAADRVTMSGHVINKVGTLTGAIAARHFGLPYYATVLMPDAAAGTPADVEMEQRDGNEVLHCLGHRTASPLARGWYPAFDITPPELVTKIVTRDGVHDPGALIAR